MALKSSGKIFIAVHILYKVLILDPFTFQNQRDKFILVKNSIFLILLAMTWKRWEKVTEILNWRDKIVVYTDYEHRNIEIGVKLLISTREALVYHEIVKKTYMILVRVYIPGWFWVLWFFFCFFKVMNEFIKLTMMFSMCFG